MTHILSRQEVLHRIQSGDLDFSGTDISGVDLSGIKFFTGEPLTDSFQPADLSRANLTGAKLIGADLTGAHLQKAKLLWTDLTGVNLIGADLTGADLTKADLTGVNMPDAKMSEVKLNSAILKNANMRWVDLLKADMSDAELQGADLIGADLTETDLTGSDLTGADLRHADFSNSDLAGANLTGTKVFRTGGEGSKLEDTVCEWFDESKTGDGSEKWYPKYALETPGFFHSFTQEVILKFKNHLSLEAISGWMEIIASLGDLCIGILEIDNSSDRGEIRLSCKQEKEVVPLLAVLLKYCVDFHCQCNGEVKYNPEVLRKIASLKDQSCYLEESFRCVSDMLEKLPPLSPEIGKGKIQILIWKNIPHGSISFNMESGEVLMEGDNKSLLPAADYFILDNTSPSAKIFTLESHIPQFIQLILNLFPPKSGKS